MPLLMPDLPPVPEFVTLPQALRWIVNDERPVPVDYLTGGDLLPYFADDERDPRPELFHHMLNGTIRLWGRFCNNVRIDDVGWGRRHVLCDDKIASDLKIISVDDLISARYESISWKYCRLEFRILIGETSDIYHLWTGLRITSADLFKIAPMDDKELAASEDKINPDAERAVYSPISLDEPGDIKNWPQDSFDKSSSGACEYSTKLLKVADYFRKEIASDNAPNRWTRPVIEAECRRLFPDLSGREITAVASVVLPDEVRFPSKSDQ